MHRSVKSLLCWSAAALLERPIIDAHPVPHGTLLPPNVYSVLDYGAKGSPHDDTVAIGRAVDAILQAEKDPKYPAERCVEHPTSPMVLYFPSGRYLVSNTIQIYPNDNATCVTSWRTLSVIVMGDSADSTTIHLADSAAGFDNPNNPKPVFLTHPMPQHNDGQWLSYMDLAISIGDGNQGAVALRHVANNIGGVENITLTAPFGAAAGIDFPLFLGGLTLFKDVRVSGFAIGVNVSQPQDMLAIEHLHVDNCTVGLQLYDKGCTVRDMSAFGVDKPIVAHHSTASLVLIDSTFNHGIAQKVAAVTSHGGQLFARNVTVSGFKYAIEDFLTNKSTSTSTMILGPVVFEYSHATPFGLATSIKKATVLPAQDTPAIPLTDPASWTIVQLIGHDKMLAETAQEAIDNGATTLYLRGDPTCKPGNETGCYYSQNAPVVVRNAIRRLHGGWNSFGAPGPYPNFPSIRVDDCAHSQPVFLEHFTNLWRLVHNSSNALVLRYVGARGMEHFGGTVYSNTPRPDIGPLFAESLMLGFKVSGSDQTGGPAMALYNQTAYIRSLDIEGYRQHAWTAGSRLWVFGAKFGEVGGNPYLRVDGGTTLMLGGLMNSFGCASWNRTSQTGDKCTAFRFEADADASVVGYYATEYDTSENATVAESQSDEASGLWLAANGSAFPPRYTWWPSSNQTAQCPGCRMVDGYWSWLRIGYHLPFFRSRSSQPGPVPPFTPLPPAPPAPPPPGPMPIPPTCEAGLAKLCPGLKCVAGKACQCSACKTCLMKNNDALVKNDGCPIKNGTESKTHPFGAITYNIIHPYCCPGPPGPPPPPGPKPPPHHPPDPITPRCKAALLKTCPGSEGGGRACKTCLGKNVATLEKEGCKPAKDGSFYNVVKPWCKL